MLKRRWLFGLVGGFAAAPVVARLPSPPASRLADVMTATEAHSLQAGLVEDTVATLADWHSLYRTEIIKGFEERGSLLRSTMKTERA